ncbi:hypothetical protein JOF41_004188 [Saccharothrix coeruleofusca]|uniref:baeRF2 domain-containing protein n=2 Tax=Saccharothrix coeruleofusca TaxID=33919 RepID=UPI001AE44E75|nr:hypothetical protein [Saccharothrix coeruleofusca]MBP2338010.1 hypothetical protein [Saccharothrix coeruleofusca]
MHTASLRSVVRAGGPFISVYFDAAQHVDLRWQTIRDRLEAQEADADSLSALDEAVARRSRQHGMTGRALIAADGHVVLDRHLPVPPRGSAERVGPLPYLLPLVDLSEPLIPHVVVQVDERSADLRGVDSSGRPVAVATVGARQSGPLPPGLDDVELRDVAQEATALVDRLRAELLVLSGPLSARRALRVALPGRCHRLVVEMEGPADPAVHHLAGRANRNERRAVVVRFRDEATRMTGRAVQGMDAVFTALSEGRVATLLLSDPLVGDRLIGGGRADEVLPLLAVEHDAEIVLVGGAVRLHEDVGALLTP